MAQPTRPLRWRSPAMMRVVRSGRRQRLQSSVRAARHRNACRAARPHAGCRRCRHRLVLRAIRGSAASRPRIATPTRCARSGRRVTATKRCERMGDRGGDPQSAVCDPRPPLRAEGHGRGRRLDRSLSGNRALCAARMGAGEPRSAGRLSRGLHRRLALVARRRRSAVRRLRSAPNGSCCRPTSQTEIYESLSMRRTDLPAMRRSTVPGLRTCCACGSARPA